MPAPLSCRALARASMAAVAVGGVLVGGGGGAAARSPHTVVVLNDNGAWSWFEDERAVVDVAAGKLLVSSVASGSGTGGASRDGNVELVAYDLATGDIERAVLHPALQADDHNSAALYVRPDGRYVAMYSKHATDRLSRWRVTDRPGDASAWGAEASLDHGAAATYSNLYAASGDGGRLFGFARSAGRDPHVIVSDDGGSTWRHGGRLLDGPGRPYVRYATDGAGRIHFVTTDQHPADYPNRVYHGVVVDGRLVRSDGAVVDGDVFDPHAVAPRRLTEVHRGTDRDHAWTIDLAVDDQERPSAVFSVYTEPCDALPLATGGTGTHRYYFARYDGTTWSVHFLAHAGRALYRDEPFYTGLVALHPHDPHRLFVSTDVDPATGRPLVSAADGRRHHELFEGETSDGGATWRWRPITADSTVDNIRPIVPAWDASHTALLWLRGTYASYQDYDLDVVGIVTSDAVE